MDGGSATGCASETASHAARCIAAAHQSAVAHPRIHLGPIRARAPPPTRPPARRLKPAEQAAMTDELFKTHAASVLQKAWVRHQIRTKLKGQDFPAAYKLAVSWFQTPFRHSDDGFKVRPRLSARLPPPPPLAPLRALLAAPCSPGPRRMTVAALHPSPPPLSRSLPRPPQDVNHAINALEAAFIQLTGETDAHGKYFKRMRQRLEDRGIKVADYDMCRTRSAAKLRRRLRAPPAGPHAPCSTLAGRPRRKAAPARIPARPAHRTARADSCRCHRIVFCRRGAVPGPQED
jgi:hypothetical protein